MLARARPARPEAQLALFDDSAPAAAPAPPPAVYRHPDARRDIALGGHVVGYSLRRARRRSIGFAVGAEGLAVAAPRWVGQGEIDAALREKSAWILAKLAEQQARAEKLRAARIEWRDGASFPFLGQPLTIALAAHPTGAMLDPGEPGRRAPRLELGLPQAAAAEQIRDAVQSWLQRQARRIFEQRCAHFAERLRVTVKRVALSSAQTRWGSANADGSVRLNWRLVHFGMATIDYVVAHELAHLRHMNHGPEFWEVVRSAVPDADAARRRLREALLPAFE
jgi:predicted metal-dependent hydrolase